MGVVVKLTKNTKGLESLVAMARSVGAKPPRVDVGVFALNAARPDEAQRKAQFKRDNIDDITGKFLPGDQRTISTPDHGGGLTNPELAAILEYGTHDGHIPPRYFLSDPIKSRQRAYLLYAMRTIGKKWEEWPEAPADYKIEVITEQLGKTGAIAAGDVQKYMANGAFTPNAESTIKAKGSSQPTIDTGALRQSISWRLVSGEEEASPAASQPISEAA